MRGRRPQHRSRPISCCHRKAQGRKANLKIWGDPTVLDLDKLTPADQALFDTTSTPGALLDPAPTIPEPHGSWVPLIEAAWLERYGA